MGSIQEKLKLENSLLSASGCLGQQSRKIFLQRSKNCTI